MRRWILLLGLVALPAWGGEGVTLVGPDGHEAVLRPVEGQVLVLHFWASWCPSCAEDINILERAAAACSKTRLRIMAVNVGEDEATVAGFVEEHGVRLPIFRDPKGRVWREIDGRGLPMNLYWTQESRRTDLGPKTAEEWRSQLASFGCEAPGQAGISVPELHRAARCPDAVSSRTGVGCVRGATGGAEARAANTRAPEHEPA